MALSGTGSAGTNRVNLDYWNPVVFQGSKNSFARMQLVDVCAKEADTAGASSGSVTFSLNLHEAAYYITLRDVFQVRTTNEVVGRKVKARQDEEREKLKSVLRFKDFPTLAFYSNPSTFQAYYTLHLPPGASATSKTEGFFTLLGFEEERQLGPEKHGFTHPLEAEGPLELRGSPVSPRAPLSTNAGAEVPTEFPESETIVVKLAQKFRTEPQTLRLELPRPKSVGDQLVALRHIARKIEEALELESGVLGVSRTDTTREGSAALAITPAPASYKTKGRQVLTVVFDEAARSHLGLERRTISADLMSPDACPATATLYATPPPPSSHNAMIDYLPFTVMTDQPPFDSWVSKHGATSVLAYFDLNGNMTSFMRNINPDFNCITLKFFKPDQTEMIFKDKLDIVAYFTIE